MGVNSYDMTDCKVGLDDFRLEGRFDEYMIALQYEAISPYFSKCVDCRRHLVGKRLYLCARNPFALRAAPDLGDILFDH
jgi:hypothetical protein